MNFADRLSDRISMFETCLCAGLDPRPDLMPSFFLAEADQKTNSSEDFIYKLLTDFYISSLEIIEKQIACVKPNSAFFEQFGIGGLKALQSILSWCQKNNLPSILDAKRGDIGSTAEAYSRAVLGKTNFLNKSFSGFNADAMTINPFLGFDTIEPFLQDCIEYEKGVFILVKTSNPGSHALQESSSEKIARWIGKNSEKLQGNSGLSGLGAVVGATYPDEAKELRKLMPNSYFLIPGFGAQGGKAEDTLAGFTDRAKGAIVNASRGIFSNPEFIELNREDFLNNISKTVDEINSSFRSLF
ncbi:MAG: orotidine-5'-phosphate decarboxylase [Bdellovibrionales bacterium]|nr:orotidine-5'-phosphate decarboxylase [Bdellovibrionales bacterium]